VHLLINFESEYTRSAKMRIVQNENSIGL